MGRRTATEMFRREVKRDSAIELARMFPAVSGIAISLALQLNHTTVHGWLKRVGITTSGKPGRKKGQRDAKPRKRKEVTA